MKGGGTIGVRKDGKGVYRPETRKAAATKCLPCDVNAA